MEKKTDIISTRIEVDAIWEKYILNRKCVNAFQMEENWSILRQLVPQCKLRNNKIMSFIKWWAF